MMTFALRGNRKPQVHAAHSRTRLEIRGCFHVLGPQIVGGEGGAPQWVADVFTSHPEIEEIAVNHGGTGVCYTRCVERMPAKMTDHLQSWVVPDPCAESVEAVSVDPLDGMKECSKCGDWTDVNKLRDGRCAVCLGIRKE